MSEELKNYHKAIHAMESRMEKSMLEKLTAIIMQSTDAMHNSGLAMEKAVTKAVSDMKETILINHKEVSEKLAEQDNKITELYGKIWSKWMVWLVAGCTLLSLVLNILFTIIIIIVLNNKLLIN